MTDEKVPVWDLGHLDELMYWKRQPSQWSQLTVLSSSTGRTWTELLLLARVRASGWFHFTKPQVPWPCAVRLAPQVSQVGRNHLCSVHGIWSVTDCCPHSLHMPINISKISACHGGSLGHVQERSSHCETLGCPIYLSNILSSWILLAKISGVGGWGKESTCPGNPNRRQPYIKATIFPRLDIKSNYYVTIAA